MAGLLGGEKIKKVARFVFETTFGLFVAWCCVLAVFFVAVVVSCLFEQLGWLVGVAFFVLVVTSLTYLAGFFIFLAEHQYRRAIWHFLLGLAGLFLFVLVAVASMMAGRAVVEYMTSNGSAVVRSGNKADCVICKNSSSNLRERDLSTFDLKSTTNSVGVSLSYKLEIKRKSI